MADLTLALNDITRTLSLAPTVSMTGPKDTPVILERSPCNWEITSLGGNLISARSRLGNTFEGTIDNFNDLLRL